MRTWGRINQVDGLGGTWQEVDTDVNGENGAVYLTDLIQVLKLNLGESPFFANYGIPAQQSVLTQVQPDYYAAMTQKQFAPYFAALTISKASSHGNGVAPVYSVSVTTLSGAIVTGPIPT